MKKDTFKYIWSALDRTASHGKSRTEQQGLDLSSVKFRNECFQDTQQYTKAPEGDVKTAADCLGKPSG
jgi:hypothetical protein